MSNETSKRKTPEEKLTEALAAGRVFLCTSCGHRNVTDTCDQCHHACVKCDADGKPVAGSREPVAGNLEPVVGNIDAADPVITLREKYNFERMREAGLCDLLKEHFNIVIDPEKVTKAKIIARLDEEIAKRVAGSR